MKRRRLHPLFALVCALFLLGAQQASYAHFLGHLGFASDTAAQPGDDAEHGAASTLSHVCTTCAAFAALDAVPSASAGAIATEGARTVPRPLAVQAYIPTATAPPYAPRAPPAVL